MKRSRRKRRTQIAAVTLYLKQSMKLLRKDKVPQMALLETRRARKIDD